jgi:hypothetical protein
MLDLPEHVCADQARYSRNCCELQSVRTLEDIPEPMLIGAVFGQLAASLPIWGASARDKEIR